MFLITSGIMQELVTKCVAGEKINTICDFGDSRLQEETSRVFKKDKEMKKGKIEDVLNSTLILNNWCFKKCYAFIIGIFTFFAGIAFPTCVSVNNCICHFSPLKSDPDKELADGDVVKMWVWVFFLNWYIKWMMLKLLAPFAFHWRNGQKPAYFHIVLGIHIYKSRHTFTLY